MDHYYKTCERKDKYNTLVIRME